MLYSVSFESGSFGAEATASRLLQELGSRGLTLATAESCTGGLVAGRLTGIPGSSSVVLGGVVSYVDAVKVGLLGVRADLLEAVGAVSPEVAREMALGARRATGASVGLATTGFAGPGGGTKENPCGTVYVALAFSEDAVMVRRYNFGANDREWIRSATVELGLSWLLETLQDARPGERRPAVGVTVIIRHPTEDKVLMGRRKGAHGAGAWAFAGGHLEFGESVERCARREALEEAAVGLGRLLYGPVCNEVSLEDGTHYVDITVVADLACGVPALMEPERCDGWDWFAWDKLPEPLFPSVRTLWEKGVDLFADRHPSPCVP